jgi:DNA-binding MarR family transcriptional regulator
VTRRLRREAEPGITESQLSALGAIKRHGPLALGELAAHEQVQPPTMTKIVAELEQSGLVDRHPDPDDRRVVRAQVTSAGRRVLQRARARKDAYLEQRLSALDDAEIEVLAQAVTVLERVLGAEE